jgi:1-deoxy-D-xylulose-5-phosphate reductoisomerase
MKKVTILGSTGSIGINTLNVIGLHKDKYEIFALAARSNFELIFEQIVEFKPKCVVMFDPLSADKLYNLVKENNIAVEIFSGLEALNKIASDSEVDIVMAAVVGAIGLSPCMAAIKAGKKLLLANKETLVLGGDLFTSEISKNSATLIPIDSEHSAIFQSLPEDPKFWATRVKKIILTASGGPFRNTPIEQFSGITPDQACAHPNWKMGKKISVDSATMMNKALEVIEAKFLFNLKPSQIEVVIHPQSIIHSMVEYIDCSIVAQLGGADMRIPIAYGLSWPERIKSGVNALDFSKLSSLTFENPDARRFPGLFLAWEVLNAQPHGTGVLNAANEVAVNAFLNKRIKFDQIHQINRKVVDDFKIPNISTIDDLISMDFEVRSFSDKIISKMMI